MAKKSVEMKRYYGSEALRKKNLQKKAINYGLKKLTPVIQNVGSRSLDQLSTKIRPNKKYKTDRKDLDGGSLQVFEINDILTDTKKLKAYQAELANYAWEQAGILGYRETLKQCLSALKLEHILQQGSGIIDKGAKDLTEDGVAGGPYRVDFKTGIKLLNCFMENSKQTRNC